MTAQQQLGHKALLGRVETAVQLLTVQPDQDSEDLQAARARLENWLTENRDRWVK